MAPKKEKKPGSKPANVFRLAHMFKSKKKKDKDGLSTTSKTTSGSDKSSVNGGDSVSIASNDSSSAAADSELYKFGMKKRVSLDRPASVAVDTPDASSAREALSPIGDLRNRSSSEAANQSAKPASKIRKSILKNSSQSQLTSPQENVEMELMSSQESNSNSRGAGDGVENSNRQLSSSGSMSKRKDLKKKRPSNNMSVPRIPLITHKSFEESLFLPKINAGRNSQPRNLVMKQNFAGDYGFTLRTSTLLEKVPLTGDIIERNVHFAESSINSTQATGLLPGDKLLKVNGVSVEGFTKEKVMNLIKENTSNEITITVQPVPELLELCQRCGLEDSSSFAISTLRNSREKTGSVGKSEELLNAEQQYALTPSYWLVHSEGYSGCTLLGSTPIGAHSETKVKLTESGVELTVDESDLEKCNPSELDAVDDICKLRYVNESSVLHVLRTRYSGNDLFHTFCGYNLAVINPAHATNAYSDKAMAVLKKCTSREEMPAHIFSSAQLAYRRMIASRRDQSVIFLGQSGSGKSENLKHVLKYLTTTAGSVNQIVTADKILASQTLLASFGCCRSPMNTNASKFTQIISLEFDYAGVITGGSIQGILLEKLRVVHGAHYEQSGGESSFNIFAQLVYGANEEESRRLNLPDKFPQSNEMPYFSHQNEVNLSSKSGSNVMATHVYNFKQLKNAMDVLSVTREEQSSIFAVIAAIFHLLAAGSVKSGNKYDFARPDMAEKAAALLGVKLQTLTRATFYGSVLGGGSTALNARAGRGMRPGGGAGLDLSGLSSRDMLEGMTMGLYQDVFNVILVLINRSLTANYRSNIAMQIIDAPGLIRNSYDESDKSGKTLEEFLVNYTHERLHQLFHDATVSNPLKLFEQERINVEFGDSLPVDPSLVIDMIDQNPTTKITKSDEEVEVKGLLWLLDEESIFPDSSASLMLDKATSIYGDRSDGLLTRKGNMLTIRHCQGVAPVTYNTENWLTRCKENPVTRVSLSLLQESSSIPVAELFCRLRSFVSGTISGTGAGDALNLRRQTQVRRGFSSITAVKKNSLCLQVKFQLDFVLELLRHTQMNFVLCLAPNLKCAMGKDSGGFSSIDVPYLRTQLQSMQVVSAARMFRVGYPDQQTFDNFIRSYSMLVSPEAFTLNPLDERTSTQKLLQALEVPETAFAIGVTKVFFRCGVLAELDEKRDNRIGHVIVDFQSFCRGYLARKDIDKIRLKHRAVACIQKNIRMYCGIREWSWWRLYTKVLPLARVALSEEERRAKVQSLEEASRKLEARDQERLQLTNQVERLEAELMELSVHLGEEQAGSQHTTQLYEQELLNRRNLEEQVKSLKEQLALSEKETARMEKELSNMRLMANSSMMSDVTNDSSEDFLDEIMFKNKLTQVRKQAEIDRKRLESELEEQRADWEKARKALERKLHDVRDDLEDRDHSINQLKKKASKFQEELQDTNLLLNQQIARNADLERKQRKFDSELHQTQQTTSTERMAKEKALSDKEHLMTEVYQLNREKVELSENLEVAEAKLKRLQEEMEDLMQTQHQTEPEVTALKRDKHQLQSKIKEQEEELDDLAGEVSQLEGVKLKLEMEIARVKTDLNKELEVREEELEQSKQSYSKKLRALEAQLDDEIHERQIISREKTELERKLRSMSNVKSSGDIEREKKLQRQLAHARGLMADMQSMLDVANAQNCTLKRESRQLKGQLEEARDEVENANATKATLQRELQETVQESEQMRSQVRALEDRVSRLATEKTELESQSEEAEEDVNSLERKLRNVISEAAIDRNCIASLTSELAELRRELLDKEELLAGTMAKLEHVQTSSVDKALLTRAEARVTELERALGVEKTLKLKSESQVSRLKSQADKHLAEIETLVSSEKSKDESMRRQNNQLRDCKDEIAGLNAKVESFQSKRRDMENQLNELEDNNSNLKQELNIANQRIAVLQRSLQDANVSFMGDSSVALDEDDGASLGTSHDDDDLDDDFESGSYSSGEDEYGTANHSSTEVLHEEKSSEDGQNETTVLCTDT